MSEEIHLCQEFRAIRQLLMSNFVFLKHKAYYILSILHRSSHLMNQFQIFQIGKVKYKKNVLLASICEILIYQHLKFIILLTEMSGLSVALKRKSIEKTQPILPKTLKIRQSSTTGRTIYENYKPVEVLKEFRKKQLYTYGNLSTQKSQSNLNIQDYVVMKQSRFDDDHHNTESIEQLLDTKMGSNLPSVRAKIQETNLKSSQQSEEKLTSQKQSQESESLPKDDGQVLSRQKQSKQQNLQQGQIEGKQTENYDDYVLGDKISEAQQQVQTKDKTLKKYRRDHKNQQTVQSTQSLVRAESIHYNNQRKKLLQLKEDQEIVSLMQKYKNNKQALLNQSKRKHQTHRIMAGLGKPPKVQKSLSLPLLKTKLIVEVPEIQSKTYQKMKRNILGKETGKQEKINSSQLISSLSSVKIGIGRKKIKTISEQEIYQEEMNTLQNIKMKLRSKGIVIDENKLSKGLVNIKNELQYQKVTLYPEKGLLSNPIYKKFPL